MWLIPPYCMPDAAHKLLHVLAEMWVLAYRDGDHAQQSTTGAVERTHPFYNQQLTPRPPMLRGRGLAKLISLFFDFLEPHFRMRAWGQLQGHFKNKYRQEIVSAALEAAKAMPPTAVRVVDAAAGSCMVQSSSTLPGADEYLVQSALGVKPTCTCPVGRGGMFCKHVAACMLAMGVAELTVKQVRGVLYGTHAGNALAAKLAAQHAAMPSAPAADTACGSEASAEAATATQAAPPDAAAYSPGMPHAVEHSNPAGAATAQRGVRAPVDQRVKFRAAVDRLIRSTDGCQTHSIRFEELERQLTKLAQHQEALNLRLDNGEQPLSQPLKGITNDFNSNSVKRVPGALDGNGKRKAARNAARHRTAAYPAGDTLLPAASHKRKRLKWQQQLAADGGDVAAAKWMGQLPADVKGSWVPEPDAGGDLLDLVVSVV